MQRQPEESLHHVDAVLALALRLPTDDARELLAMLPGDDRDPQRRLVSAFVRLREEMDAVIQTEAAR